MVGTTIILRLINHIPKSAWSWRGIRWAREKGHLVCNLLGAAKAEMSPEIWICLQLYDGMIGGGNSSYVEHKGQVVLLQLIPRMTSLRLVDWLQGGRLGFYLESNNGLYSRASARQHDSASDPALGGKGQSRRSRKYGGGEAPSWFGFMVEKLYRAT